jgi:hypothetical protein
VSAADWHSQSSIVSHRHLWLREGHIIEVCAICPAARPRSRVARALSLVVLVLGLLAVAGMLAGISLSDGPLRLASCSKLDAHLSRGPGGGC